MGRRGRCSAAGLGALLAATVVVATACGGPAGDAGTAGSATAPASATAVPPVTAASGSARISPPPEVPAPSRTADAPPTTAVRPQVPAVPPRSVSAVPPRSVSAIPQRSGSAAAIPPPRTADTADVARAHRLTISFAGDVNFADRTADRLTADPATAFGAAAAPLSAADLTMVNLETAITTGGQPEPKEFTFRAPPSALTALRSAGVDVATMANNHGADYGASGLRDSIAAIADARFPVIGIGADAARAAAPYRATVHGVRVAIFAASAVRDRTLEAWTAGPGTPGIASAFDPALVDRVRAAAASGETVLVYLHWGTEFTTCPDGDQQALADSLAEAGATAVIGTHAHVLQGAGWRPDGTYVAYGLGNYLWWRSFGNDQDDNGILTLTIDGSAVTAARFDPAHLDDTGVPVPAVGAERSRILATVDERRGCAALSGAPPS